MRFKIDRASLIVGSKFTVFALFYFVFEGNFPSTSPRGAYIWRGDLTEGFCVTGLGGLYLEGLIFGILHNFFISILNELLVVANDSFPNKKVFLRKVRPRSSQID